MSRVVDLLVNLGSQDAHVRKGAEDIINNARDDNIGAFLMELIYVVRDESIGSAPRQQALILLKNTVAFDAKDEENKRLLKARWGSVGPDMKQTIRRELLNTLGSADRAVRHIAALVVSNLARLELPVNQWADLIDSLYSACQSEKYQEAAIITLGYICEESATCSPLEARLQEYGGKILQCVIDGMQKSDSEVCYQATKALCGSIAFIHVNMEIPEQRDYIFKSLFNSCNHKDTRVGVKALECLTRIAYEYYSILGSYMHILLEITVHAIKSEEEEKRLQGFQFWTCICEVEVELRDESGNDASQRFSTQSAPRVLPLCLDALLTQDEDRAEDEWDSFAAGGVCLQSYAQAMEGEVIQYVIPFITANIGESEPRKKDAAITAFGGIIDGPYGEHLSNFIIQAFPALLSFTTVQNHRSVRLSSIWCISRIADFHSSVIFNNFLDQTVQAAASLIQEGSIIASKSCAIIHNLCSELDQVEKASGIQETNGISKYFQSLLQVLLASIANRSSDEHGLSGAAQETLNSLLSCAAKDMFVNVHRLIPEITTRVKYNVDIVNSPMVDAQTTQAAQMMLGLLCGTIQHITVKLGSELGQDEGQILMGAVFSILGLNGGLLQGEPIMAMGSVASALRASFTPYLNECSRYVFECLKLVDDEHLFTLALGTISDIFWSLKETLPEQFRDSIMLTLLEAIQHQDLSNHSKVQVLSCFGDVAFNLGLGFEKYLSPVMNVIDMASAFVKDVPEGNYEMLDFRDELIEASCETFTGIIQGLKEKNEVLFPHVLQIARFIGEFGTREDVPEKCTEQCVVVLGDILNALTTSKRIDSVLHEINGFIGDQRVTSMIQKAKHSNSESMRSSAQWTQEQIVNFLRNYMSLTGNRQ